MIFEDITVNLGQRQWAGVLFAAGQQSVHYYCLSENINYTANETGKAISGSSRKHAEVDESRLNPSIRGGLLLRLTLSLLPLANVAAIFKRS